MPNHKTQNHKTKKSWLPPRHKPTGLPSQVLSTILHNSAPKHCIIGQVALMHYQSHLKPPDNFAIEICVPDTATIATMLKKTHLFREVEEHISTPSAYEGTLAQPRLQTTWSASPRIIILLPAQTFYDTSCVRKLPHDSATPNAAVLPGLAREDGVNMVFPNPHQLFVSLVNRRVSHHDQIAGLAARRLFETGLLDVEWLDGMNHTWRRKSYDIAMALIGRKPGVGEKPPKGTRNKTNGGQRRESNRRKSRDKMEDQDGNKQTVVKVEPVDQCPPLKRRRTSEGSSKRQLGFQMS